MSIRTEIERINANIASAYSAVQEKGGGIPEQANSANLAMAIQAIPASSGGGSPTNVEWRSVTLPQSDWSDGTQTIQVPGVLADETKQLIQPTPTIASQRDYYKSGILCTAQATGELTFTTPREPTADIDLIVVITSLVSGSSSTEPEPDEPEPAYRIIGVMWDSSDDSTALTRLTPETDPNRYVNTTIKTDPVAAVGTGSGSSPFDKYYPWSDMEQYNIGTNSVLYKRGDAEFSQTAYDTMVYIPKFYYKVINDGTKWYWYVSSNQLFDFEKHPGSERYVGRYHGSSRTFYPNTETLSINSDIVPYAPGATNTYTSRSGTTPAVGMTRATGRTYSHNRGDNWWLFDIATLSAIQLLYLVEYADWNSQAKIGRGIVDDTSAHVSGETDLMVYHTGRAEGEDGYTAVQYRWIENPFGNVFSWVDGLEASNLTYYIAINTNSSATSTGISMSTTNGYISNIKYSSEFPWSFIPSEKDGSNNIKIPDAALGNQTLSAVTPYLPSYNRDSVSGGCFGLGDNAGMFCYWFPDKSVSDAHVGSRLIYIP